MKQTKPILSFPGRESICIDAELFEELLLGIDFLNLQKPFNFKVKAALLESTMLNISKMENDEGVKERFEHAIYAEFLHLQLIEMVVQAKARNTGNQLLP